MLMSPNFFSPFSRKMLFSLKKMLVEKKIKISFPKKKGYIHFVARRPLSFKKDLAPETVFHYFLGKYRLFKKKPLNDKIFGS